MRLLKNVEDVLKIYGAYRRVFESEDGKIVLQHLMKTGFVTKSTFVAGDSHRTALNEGSRRLALSIIKLAGKNPKELLTDIEQGLQND